MPMRTMQVSENGFDHTKSIKAVPDLTDATHRNGDEKNETNLQFNSNTCMSIDHHAEHSKALTEFDKLKKKYEHQTQEIEKLREELRLQSDVLEQQLANWEQLLKETQKEHIKSLKDVKEKQWCHECWGLVDAKMPVKKQLCKRCSMYYV